jgi:RHS repeat-associated protein
MGFTTKEADEEIGMTYFGERWLIPRLGRWATPDPLHIHASGGGETGNSYHYVSGNLLQAVDPLGLEAGDQLVAAEGEALAREQRDSGARESWTSIDGIDFNEGTVEARHGLNDAEWAVAEIRDAERGGTQTHLYYRQGGESGEWTRYDACAFDRCGSARPDPVGQAVIDFVLTAGANVLLEGAAEMASTAAGGALFCSCWAVRVPGRSSSWYSNDGVLVAVRGRSPGDAGRHVPLATPKRSDDRHSRRYRGANRAGAGLTLAEFHSRRNHRDPTGAASC